MFLFKINAMEMCKLPLMYLVLFFKKSYIITGSFILRFLISFFVFICVKFIFT